MKTFQISRFHSRVRIMPYGLLSFSIITRSSSSSAGTNLVKKGKEPKFIWSNISPFTVHNR